MQNYPKPANRLAPSEIMRKAHIVKDRDGRDLAREVAIDTAANLSAAYDKIADRLRARYPSDYHFCDASEGSPVNPPKFGRKFVRVA
jgi:hypothetical protein